LVQRVEFQSTPPRGRRPAGYPGGERPKSFNPRLRAGGDIFLPMTMKAILSFNPRLRAGGDGLLLAFFGTGVSFNPRLRAGGDRNLEVLIDIADSFNPRLRAGGDGNGCCAIRRRKRFNPRLRAGGDVGLRVVVGRQSVSIHASAREATYWGCSGSGPSRFQSTPPRGRRRRAEEGPHERIVVSIHASAREATQKIVYQHVGFSVSIHASAREATPLKASTALPPSSFQSTPPRGRRPSLRVNLRDA